MKNKNMYKMILDESIISNNSLIFVKLKDYNDLRQYNSEKFSKILANKCVFVNENNCRVEARFNPHISKLLVEQRCDNYRIDGFSNCVLKYNSICIDKRREYKIDFDMGIISRSLSKNERICRCCNSIVDKSQIVGAYCEKCLTEPGSLAYRFSYHGYNEPYTIYENVDQSKVALFGAEIERDYLGRYSYFDDDLKHACVGAVKTIYGNKLNSFNVERKAVFMKDGSLTEDGIEWITFPQTYKGYKKEKDKINEVLQIMKKFNFGNSKKAGNHIHINRKFFGDTDQNKDDSRFAGAKMALLINEFWKEFIAIAKREETGYTQKPSQNKNDKIFSLVAKTICDECNHAVAVNLQHNQTIEIRIWSGIDNASDLLLYLDLTQALATFAKKKSLETCQKAKLEDIFVYLVDKKEHLQEIKTRLNDKNITKYNNKLDKMIEEA